LMNKQYDGGYTPEGLRDTGKFAGDVVHPQAWPAHVSVVGKRVAVIGSGATAVTLVPELAKMGAKHVICVQRSPTYLMDVWKFDW